MKNSNKQKEQSVIQALQSANGCLIENGGGPPALTPKAIEHLAEPLVDDLEARGWKFVGQV